MRVYHLLRKATHNAIKEERPSPVLKFCRGEECEVQWIKIERELNDALNLQLTTGETFETGNLRFATLHNREMQRVKEQPLHLIFGLSVLGLTVPGALGMLEARRRRKLEYVSCGPKNNAWALLPKWKKIWKKLPIIFITHNEFMALHETEVQFYELQRSVVNQQATHLLGQQNTELLAMIATLQEKNMSLVRQQDEALRQNELPKPRELPTVHRFLSAKRHTAVGYGEVIDGPILQIDMDDGANITQMYRKGPMCGFMIPLLPETKFAEHMRKCGQCNKGPNGL